MKLNEINAEKSILDMPELARYANQRYAGDFACHRKQLTSLEGAPASVSGSFRCGHNRLESLAGAPARIGGGFYCNNNLLLSLKGGPVSVGGEFHCQNNQLVSLEGAPTTVGGTFSCQNNKLISFEGAPRSIEGNFYCDNNRLASLKDIHRHIKSVKGMLDFSKNPIRSHVLGVLLIKGVTTVMLDNEAVKEILNRHLPSNGIDSVLAAQEELLDAGLDDYAEI